MNVIGSFNQSNLLQDLNVVSKNVFLLENSPKLPGISAKISRLGDGRYEADVKGTLDKFELSNSGNFIGMLPSGYFEIDLDFDSEIRR